MFGPYLVSWMQSAPQCKCGVLPSLGHVGLPVMALRWTLAPALRALALFVAAFEFVLFCTLYHFLSFHFYFLCIVLLL